MSVDGWVPPIDFTPAMRQAWEETIWELSEASLPRLIPENRDVIEACARLRAELGADTTLRAWELQALGSFMNYLGLAGAGSRQQRWRKPSKLAAKVNLRPPASTKKH